MRGRAKGGGEFGGFDTLRHDAEQGAAAAGEVDVGIALAGGGVKTGEELAERGLHETGGFEEVVEEIGSGDRLCFVSLFDQVVDPLRIGTAGVFTFGGNLAVEGLINGRGVAAEGREDEDEFGCGWRRLNAIDCVAESRDDCGARCVRSGLRRVVDEEGDVGAERCGELAELGGGKAKLAEVVDGAEGGRGIGGAAAEAAADGDAFGNGHAQREFAAGVVFEQAVGSNGEVLLDGPVDGRWAGEALEVCVPREVVPRRRAGRERFDHHGVGEIEGDEPGADGVEPAWRLGRADGEREVELGVGGEEHGRK